MNKVGRLGIPAQQLEKFSFHLIHFFKLQVKLYLPQQLYLSFHLTLFLKPHVKLYFLKLQDKL